jgi:hypothetical protein
VATARPSTMGWCLVAADSHRLATLGWSDVLLLSRSRTFAGNDLPPRHTGLDIGPRHTGRDLPPRHTGRELA